MSLFLTIGAMAQVIYTPNHTGAKTRTNRFVSSISVGNNTYTMPNGTRNSYTDLTTTKTFTVEAGATVTLGIANSGSEAGWMNAFVYVDMDNNGFTAGIASDNYTPTGDLVSYSFYNQGYTNDENGRNSAGTSISGNNRNTLALPSWTVPTNLAPGEYRIRFKYDWCNINPAGDTGTYFNGTFTSHGGEIIDAKLVVTEPQYKHNTSNMWGSRKLNSFTITDGTNILRVTDIQPTQTSPVYVDKSTNELITTAGSTIRFEEFDWAGEWMHAYAYIDYNKDYSFKLENNNNGTGTGEIVSYNYYNSETITGITSSQQYAIANVYDGSKALPAFTLPTNLSPGKYRMRIKIDWNNLDADYGASDIAKNGGCQCDITIVIAEPYTLNVTSAGWATLYLNFPAAIPTFDGEDAGAYIVTGVKEGNWLNLVKVTGVLPANTGVIIKADQGGYTFAYSTNEADDVTDNLLEGTVTDKNIEGEAYVLGYAEGTTDVVFGKAKMNGTSWKNNANKAYLPVSNLPAGTNAAYYSFRFGEGTTAIENVEVENEVKAIFDLTGRRVEAITAPGIYIVNGKKVLVK